MDQIEFVYTFGMTEDEIVERLRSRRNGMLALANDGAAYAVPISYYYEGGTLYLRLAAHETSTKMEYLETTTEACFLVFDYGRDGSSWSVVALGSLRQVAEPGDVTTLNERFPELRIFDEDIEDVSLTVFELDVTELTGRQTRSGEE